MKKTKIICTIGPASMEKKVMERLLKHGMNAIRINTAHGDKEQYTKIINTVRSLSEIPVIIDIKGAELRIFSDKEYYFKKGDIFKVGFSSKNPIYLKYNVYKDIKIGDTVLISDGTIECVVTKKLSKLLYLKASRSFTLKTRKNVTVLDRHINVPPLSVDDRDSIKFALKKGVEFIALSYTRNKDDVERLKKILKGKAGIIAKIENKEGYENLSEILEVADVIMVARGSLGVELPAEKVPLIQKEIIEKCNQAGKPVITATQMLESMIESPVPTRAETSDVANAILDGTDAVMLSGETTIGKYPERAVKVMSNVAKAMEPNVENNVGTKRGRSISESIASSIHHLLQSLNVDKIVTVTQSGYTARIISRFRINKSIIAVTNSKLVKRQLELVYGVTPLFYENMPNHDTIINVAGFCYKKKELEKTDVVLFTAGIHTKKEHTSNTIQVHKMKDISSHL